MTIHAACYTLGAALDAASDYEYWNQHGNQTGHDDGNQTGYYAPEAPGEFDSTKWHAVSVAMQVYFWPWAPRLDRAGNLEPNTLGVFILLGLLGTLAAIALPGRSSKAIFTWTIPPQIIDNCAAVSVLDAFILMNIDHGTKRLVILFTTIMSAVKVIKSEKLLY